MKKITITIIAILFASFILTNISCERLDVYRVIKVKTYEGATEITDNNAYVSGSFIDMGNNGIVDWGFCYATSSNPTINSDKVTPTGEPRLGGFNANIGNLAAGTTYYVRSFAQSSSEIVYGNETSFETIVSEKSDVTISYPTQGITLVIGTTYEITWTSNFSENVDIELFNGTASYLPLATNYTNGGSFSWKVENVDVGTSYRIKITSNSDVNKFGFSNDFIISTTANPITISTPVGGDSWAMGTSQNIIWNANVAGNVKVELFKSNQIVSDPYGVIDGNAASSTNYVWEIPMSGLISGTDYQIKVSDLNDLSTFAFSPEFTITDYVNPITIESPYTDSIWEMGTTHDIIWTCDATGEVKIELYKNGSLVDPDGLLVENQSQNGSYSWPVPPTGLEVGSDYQIKIIHMTDETINEFSPVFTISEMAGIGTLTDVDGNNYKTVVIGDQTWMIENFKGITEKDGSIPLVGYYSYQGIDDNITKHGRLYTWDAAKKGAPEGWHLPSYNDWNELKAYLINNGYGHGGSGSDIAKSMASTSGWVVDATSGNVGNNQASNNASKFSALPGGFRMSTGTYSDINTSGLWWTSTLNSDPNYWYAGLYNSQAECVEMSTDKSWALSVRYIKDETVTDIDGNIYDVVEIGTQKWMKQNLKVTKYSDGTAIPFIGNVPPVDDDLWAGLGDNNTDKAFCYYNISGNTNGEIYGALYTYAATTNGDNDGTTQGVCPTGWHIPSDAEWTQLTDYLGGLSVAGGAMKAKGDLTTGNGLWTSPNTGASNSSEFSAVPGAFRSGNNGTYEPIGNNTYFWSSTENGVDDTWLRSLTYNNSIVTRNDMGGKSFGYSVRCIKD